jgi:alkylated DNA nucleotide flippase Atl1
MASLVAAGEWTTYGDISAAVHAGDKTRARRVARSAANDHSFPNAHRVLAHDGSVVRAPGNEAEQRRAIGRLRREGIEFDARGHADRSRRLHWDALRRRAGRRAVRERRA